MKRNVKTLLTTMLVFALFTGCFATLPLTANANDGTIYTITDFVDATRSQNTIYYKDGTIVPAYSTLMQLEDENGNAIFAFCIDRGTYTYLDVQYQMVSLADYAGLSNEQKDEILAVLNYISIKYGFDTPKGTALVQTTIWRIVHPEIDFIIPQGSTGLTRADVDDVFGKRSELVNQYAIEEIEIQGEGNKVSEDANYAYYGPFNVLYIDALSEISFDLEFIIADADAEFVADIDGDAITQVKVGEEFYVRVPVDTIGYFEFDATASQGANRVTGIDFLVSIGGGYQNLVLFQPLVQPILTPIDNLHTYTCTGRFTIEVEKIVLTGLNWNNGNTNNKDGANGAGINQFTVNGITLKNNKNYVTPANFDAAITKAPVKNDETAIYTVTERTVTINGAYEKVYDVKVALFEDGSWKGYGGTITVNNPGGNDKNQQIDLLRIF